jgi:hypothetical protein
MTLTTSDLDCRRRNEALTAARTAGSAYGRSGEA